MKFCHDNNIVLCELPSHTSHKTQPCDVAAFALLKTAYRDRVEELYCCGANTIGKQYFTLLCDQTRRAALTPSNIQSGWAAESGLYPSDPTRVLPGIEKPLSQDCQNSHAVDITLPDELLRTPETSEHLISLLKVIEQNETVLDNHGRQCFQKVANAAEMAMSARNLLSHENFDLVKQNNESNVQTSTKSSVVWKGDGDEL